MGKKFKFKDLRNLLVRQINLGYSLDRAEVAQSTNRVASLRTHTKSEVAQKNDKVAAYRLGKKLYSILVTVSLRYPQLASGSPKSHD